MARQKVVTIGKMSVDSESLAELGMDMANYVWWALYGEPLAKVPDDDGDWASLYED